ncbi:hypothetical protein NON00_10865 [Roseomonas sp. GC11]|uniref:hypothetical protein n=1 Tax=Roseomonas sp. GC11 TaxID=2950546 RepID=UPI00210D1D51|nr:hypothetical protein [Roseomonas sp. GC11]MCQ4160429.1 hypothetical protein [Roseomonas sp. GC11]
MPAETLSRLRDEARRLRGGLLILLALPLLPTLLLALIQGSGRQITGLLLGLLLLATAIRTLRRSLKRRHGRRAAVMVGVATALLAVMVAGVPVPGGIGFGLIAGFGARLLYVRPKEEEAEEEAARAEPPPPEAAAPPPPDLLEVPRARLAGLAAADARLRPAVAALRDLLAELALRPAQLHEARRFLNLQLDGLERIDTRLRAGAEPPESLPLLVEDMARGSLQMRDRLRAAETEALEIQVKVLADRLRQEGYAS